MRILRGWSRSRRPLAGGAARPDEWPVLIALLALAGLLVTGTDSTLADGGARISSSPNAPEAQSLPSSGPVLNSVIATIPDISAPLTGTFDPANGELYFPDSNAGPLAGLNSSNLTIISGADQGVVGQVFLGQYSNVQTPTFVPSNDELYIPDQNATDLAENVTALSSANRLLANIDTGNASSPTTGVYDPTNKYLYVSDQSSVNPVGLVDNVSVIDTTSNTLLTQIAVGTDPTPGVLDPTNGFLYVPDSDSLETNLSVINTSSNSVAATISGLSVPLTPAYDPVDGEVYVPNSGGSTVSVIEGTKVVAALSTGPSPSTPAVDPTTGDVYVPDETDDVVLVFAPATNDLLATIDGGTTYVGDEAPLFDPADSEVYVPAENEAGTQGYLDALDPATNTLAVAIVVGSSPGTPTYDSSNHDLYVPSFDNNTISVIATGTTSTTSPTGTYTVTFEESGLPAGAYWSVQFNGTLENLTSSTLTFLGIPNGTQTYTIEPWDDEDACVLDEPSDTGSVTVAGSSVNVAITFKCAGTSASSASPKLLDLPVVEAYALLGGGVVAALGLGGWLFLRAPRVPKVPPPPSAPPAPPAPPLPPPPLPPP